jgi:cytochrome c-type biogenesis protein CcmH/NrfG
MSSLREFRRSYDAGMAKGEIPNQQAKALKLLHAALESLRQAAQQAGSGLVCLGELTAETLLEISILEGRGYAAASQAFEAVLQLEPRFVPARVQLARIALLEGDLPRAHAIWQDAYRRMPFNHFVFNFRELVEKPNPQAVLTSRPASEMFTTEEQDEKGKG